MCGILWPSFNDHVLNDFGSEIEFAGRPRLGAKSNELMG